jgi:hypothetical protein
MLLQQKNGGLVALATAATTHAHGVTHDPSMCKGMMMLWQTNCRKRKKKLRWLGCSLFHNVINLYASEHPESGISTLPCGWLLALHRACLSTLLYKSIPTKGYQT